MKNPQLIAAVVILFSISEVFSVSPPMKFKSKSVDKTKQERAFGAEVVDAVIRRIRRSQVFPDDYDFLRRIAFLETDFGADNKTFRDGYYGGIWQVPEMFLNITKSDKLADIHRQIRSAFDLDWKTVTWPDLIKPLHCGLAIRLYLHTLSPNIPQTISKQALLYEKVYNKRDGSSQFFSKITEFENTAEKCKGLFDLTVVMDGSGSVGKRDFELSKDFVIQLFSTYSSTDLRKGFILFGHTAYMVFPLNNNFTTPQLQDIVRNVKYPSESTNTNAGIMMAVQMIQNSNPRPGVPSIMIVFTDGESNVGDGVSNIKYAKQSNITTFAIGIGGRLNQSELLQIAYNDSSRVMVVREYNILNTLAHRLNAETCLVSHKPNFNETVEDTLAKDEKRYFSFPMTPDGVTIYVNKTKGETEGFYSFTEENPSESVHDGLIDKEETFISPPNELLDKFTSSETTETFGDSMIDEQIYISMNGLEDGGNIYSIKAVEGDGKPRNKTKNNGISKPDFDNQGGASGNGGNSSITGNGNNGNSSSDGNGGDGTNGNSPDGSSGGTGGSNPSNGDDGSGVGGKGNSSGEIDGDGSGRANSTNGQNKWNWNSSDDKSRDKGGNTDGAGGGNNSTTADGGTSGSTVDVGGLPKFTGAGFTGQRNVRCPDNQVAFQPFPGRCDLYTLCACGVKVLLECSPGLHFDPSLSACNFIQLVDCAYTPFPELVVIKDKQG